MYTSHLSQARRVELPGRVCNVLVGPGEPLNSDKMTFGVTEVPPNSKMEPHAHVQEEIIYILQGHGQVVIDGKAEHLLPRTVIHLPDGKPHYIINESNVTMMFTFVFHPTVKVGSYDTPKE